MNLGQFIDQLEKLDPKDWIWIADSPVTLRPAGFDSYRGHYEDLAIAAETGRSPRLVREVLDEAKRALDQTFTGYKGGEYRMNRHTRIWISNYGECSGARATGIREVPGVGAWEITWEKGDG
jgi:hypothetical protein